MQQKVYKLTNKDRKTYGGFLYEPNKVYTFPGRGRLCTSAYSHAYKTPELAVLFNPIHGGFKDPYLLFECEGVVEKDDGTKLGLTQITVPLLPIMAPKYSALQRIAWGIGSAYKCHSDIYEQDAMWIKWANNWLMGSDRSAGAADAATLAYATNAATLAYATSAAYAAGAASAAAHAAGAAADVIGAAAYAAGYAATYAAAYAAAAAGTPDVAIVALWAKKHSDVWDINTLGNSRGWDNAKSME